MEQWRGKDLIFLGGGIAMPPIRCAIWYALENRADYGDITIVYGARTVGDLVYADELDNGPPARECASSDGVDPGGETPDWKGEIGFVPTVFERAQVAAGNAVAAGDRAADHDQEHDSGAGTAGRENVERVHQPGESNEVRHRQVRAV